MDKLPVDIATAEQPTPTITEAVPEHHAAIRRLLGDAYAGYAAAMPADVFPVYLADLLDITAEAVVRLDHLRAHGPTPRAFTFRKPFPAPGGAQVRRDDGWFCPA